MFCLGGLPYEGFENICVWFPLLCEPLSRIFVDRNFFLQPLSLPKQKPRNVKKEEVISIDWLRSNEQHNKNICCSKQTLSTNKTNQNGSRKKNWERHRGGEKKRGGGQPSSQQFKLCSSKVSKLFILPYSKADVTLKA